MRLAIAVTALLISFATANAAVGDRFSCDVAHVRNIDPHGRPDDRFIANNMQNRYEIIIRSNSILTTYTYEGQVYSKDHTIVADTQLDLIATRSDMFSFNSISISKNPNSRYNNMYPATLTVQGAFFVNVWILMCSRTY
jgi:hypothetical protein